MPKDPVGFHPSDNTIRFQLALETHLQQELQNVQSEVKTTIVKGADLQKTQATNLGLIGVLKQWVHSLVGDVLRWNVERQAEEEPLVGIPADDAEHLISLVEAVDKDLDALRETLAGNKGGKAAKKKVDEIVSRNKKRLEEVATMIDDYSIEESDEDEDVELLLDDDEGEEETEAPADDSLFEDEEQNTPQETANV